MSRISVREQADGKLIGWQPSTDPAHRGLQKPPPRRVASLNTDGSWQLPSVPAPEFLSRVLTVPLENPSIEGITTLANNFTHLATLSANFLSFAVSGAFCDRAAVGTALEITLEVAAVKNCCNLGVFAVQTAQRLGFSLSDIKSKEVVLDSAPAKPDMPLARQFIGVSDMPAAVSELFNSHCLVHVGILSGGRVWNTLNSHLAEYAAIRGFDQTRDLQHASLTHMLARMLWRLLDREDDRRPVYQALSRVLSSKMSPIDAACVGAQAGADEMLTITANKGSHYVQGLSSMGVPLEQAPNESEVTIPHRAFSRVVRLKHAERDVLIIVTTLEPFFGDGGFQIQPSVSDEEALLAMLDSDAAAEALSGGDETFVSEVLAAMESMEVGDICLGDSCDL